MQGPRVVPQVVEKHHTSAARVEVLRQTGSCRVGIRRLEQRRHQNARKAPERLAHDRIVGHLLKVAVGRRRIAKSERLQVDAGLVLGEIWREKEV